MAKQTSKGQALGGFNSDLDEAIAKIGALDTAVHALDSTIKLLQADAGKLRKEISGIDVSNVKGIKELNAKQQEANKIKVDSIKLEQQQQKLLLDKERLTQAMIRTEKMKNSESKKTLTSYQQESRALTEMRNRYKDLAVQKMNGVKLTRDEEKEYRRLIPQIRQTDQALKKIDGSVGQFGRNVGNYTKTVSGFKSVLGSLGVAFGAGAFISNAKDVVVQFDNAIADLSAITGATGKDLDFFKKQAIELGVEVKGGASAVVEAYKLIASAKPELLENASALNSVTESAILLSKASGMELPAAATALTDAMNQFGADADQAAKFVDVLAAGAKFGSAEIPQITEALLRFGAVAKTSNVNIQESTALIEDLAEKGLKGADAGTALRNVMLKLSAPDALPKDAQIRLKQLGVNFDDLRDKSKPFAERLESLKPLLNDNAALVKVFGTENAVAATTLISTTDRIKELTASVDENNIAQEQADARSKTLSEAYNRFKETINGLILEFVDGKNASSGMADALDFLRENIGTVLSIAKEGVKVFILYKTTLMSLKLYDQIKNFKDMGNGIKDVTGKFTDGSTGAKAFGMALKSISFAVVIELLFETAKAIKSISDESYLAETRLKNLQAATEGGEKATAFFVNKTTDALKKRNEQIDLMNVSEKERIRLRKDALSDANKELAVTLSQTKILYREVDAKRKRAKAIRDEIKAGFDWKFATTEQAKLYREAEDKVSELTSVQEKYRLTIEGLKNATGSLNTETHDLTVEENNLAVSTGKTTKKIEEKTKAYKDAEEAIKRQLDLEREAVDLSNELAQFETEQDIDEELNSQLKNIDKEGQYGVDRLDELLQQEYDLRKESIERQYQLAIEGQQSEQLIANERAKADLELLKLEEENIDKKKGIHKQLEDAQEEHVGKMDKITEKAAKKNYDNERKYIEITTKFWEDQIDKRISKLNELTEASKKEQQNLQELANSGNIQAQQSIAREAEIQREAEKEKAKLEQRKLYLQAFSAFMTNYTNRLEKGEDSTQALAGAVADKAVLEAILATLPAFFDGADRLSANGRGVDGIGGFFAINHPDERIVPKKDNDKLVFDNGKDIPNEMLPSIVNQWKAGIGLNMMDVKTIEKSSDQQIIQKLDELTRAVKNQPDRYPEMEQVVKGVVNLYFNEKKGNRSTRTINQYRTKG